jgi:site-specific recombinase XerD
MKKVININFQGRVIPIEENAFEILNKYVESLRKFFANEEGRDEIINDIEGRIAELFGETLKKGGTCITEDDVNRIIDSMGRPEDFDDEEANVKSQIQRKKQKNYLETRIENF